MPWSSSMRQTEGTPTQIKYSSRARKKNAIYRARVANERDLGKPWPWPDSMSVVVVVVVAVAVVVVAAHGPWIFLPIECARCYDRAHALQRNRPTLYSLYCYTAHSHDFLKVCKGMSGKTERDKSVKNRHYRNRDDKVSLWQCSSHLRLWLLPPSPVFRRNIKY